MEKLTLPSYMDQPWSTLSSIEKLCDFAEQQLGEKDYDKQGWEFLVEALSVVRSALERKEIING